LNVVPLTIKRANEVVGEYHRHNKPTSGGLFAIGALHNGELVGAAIVGRPVARHLDNKFTAEVTRTCVMPSAPKNTTSFLYGACRRIAFSMGYEKVITYTLQTESGASLRGAGWQMELELAPRSGWDTPSRRRKPGTVDGVGKRRWCSVAN
jgi:hypothetical protein